MSLVPLIYPKNNVDSIDFADFSESRFELLARNATKSLASRLRRKTTARGLVKKETLEERIHSARIRLSIFKRSNPLPILSRRYQPIPKGELERLARINHVYAKLITGNFLSENLSVLYGQSLELIQELRAGGYYVFTHGQKLSLGAYSDIITEIWRSTQEKDIDPLHRRWRKEGESKRWMNVQEYMDSVFVTQTDEDNRKSILCVDGIFSRTDWAESALSFYQKGINIWKNDLETLLKSLFNKHNKDFTNKLVEFSTWLERTNGSRMNVIAIPKHLLQDEDTCFVYRSHAFGWECNCYDLGHEAFLKTLEQHQNNIVKQCSSQYRILTYPLDLYEEVRTFTFDTLSGEDKERFEQWKKEILEKANDVR